MTSLTAGQKERYAVELAQLGVAVRAVADTLRYRGLITWDEMKTMRETGDNMTIWAARIDPMRRVK